jgi:hypothetical protein
MLQEASFVDEQSRRLDQACTSDEIHHYCISISHRVALHIFSDMHATDDLFLGHKEEFFKFVSIGIEHHGRDGASDGN